MHLHPLAAMFMVVISTFSFSAAISFIFTLIMNLKKGTDLDPYSLIPFLAGILFYGLCSLRFWLNVKESKKSLKTIFDAVDEI